MRGRFGLEAVEYAERFGAVINELPGTVQIVADFALAIARTAARTVEQAFGTTGKRANPGEFAEEALAASGAFLGPDTLRF